MKNLKFIFPVFIFTLTLFSCNNSSEADQKKVDSMFPQQSANPNAGKTDSAAETANDQPEKPFHLSPADSTRVADSVYNSRNGVRDFQ